MLHKTLSKQTVKPRLQQGAVIARNLLDNNSLKITKDEIIQMSKDEIVDFLVNNWHEMTRMLPENRKKEFFNSHPEKPLKEIALSLID